MNDQLTQEELSMLDTINKQMDEGLVPYVLKDGHRMAVSGEIMKSMNLTIGQSITLQQSICITTAAIAHCNLMLNAH